MPPAGEKKFEEEDKLELTLNKPEYLIFIDCTVVLPSMLTPSTPNPGDLVMTRLSSVVEIQCIKIKADRGIIFAKN